MNDRMNRSCFWLSLTTSAIIIAGCGAKSYQKQRYLLNARRAPSTVAGDRQSIVEVRRFTIDPAFSAKGLTYRKSEFEYESDFYNESLIATDAMVTEKVRNWLSAAGLSRRVLDPGSYMDPTYVLEGNVVGLYGDFRNNASPKAVMEIRVFLLDMKTSADPAIVFGKTYNSSAALESKGAGGVIGALDRCLVEILTDLEEDLVEYLP